MSDWIPRYINRTEEKKPGSIIKAQEDWNSLFNVIITQGNYNSESLVEVFARLNQAEADILSAVAGNLTTGSIYDPAFFAPGVVDSTALGSEVVQTQHIEEGAITPNKLAGSAFKDLIATNLKTIIDTVPTRTYEAKSSYSFTIPLEGNFSIAFITVGYHNGAFIISRRGDLTVTSFVNNSLHIPGGATYYLFSVLNRSVDVVPYVSDSQRSSLGYFGMDKCELNTVGDALEVTLRNNAGITQTLSGMTIKIWAI